LNQLGQLYRCLLARPILFVVLVAVLFVFFNRGTVDSSHSKSARFETIGGGAAESISKKGTAYGRSGNLAPATTMADDASGSAPSGTSLVDLLTPLAHAQENAMLIRNGHISAYVDSLQTSKQKISELIKAQSAHIESENQSDEYDNTVLRLTIKIPAEKFQTLFDELLKLSERVRSHSVNVEDILKQYTDIKSRLANKIELQNRLRALLQEASKVSDILEIERELARVSEDIDSSTKIMKQYENDVRLSTIHLDLSQPKPHTAGPAPLYFFKRVGLALLAGWEMILELILEIISWWPLWLAIAAGYFWYRRRKNR
jgi:Domain of unknown function (DUF4349)